MKNRSLLPALALALCLPVATALAKDKPGKGGDKDAKSEKARGKDAKPGKESAKEKDDAAGSKEKGGHKFSANERQVVNDWVKVQTSAPGPGQKAPGLPPGLQKKVARGGKLPPGWQKKLSVGEVMPLEVYQETHPLPPAVVVRLPPPPAGVITVVISGKVVRLLEATREILDVFEIGR
jgi:hypothetical protein